jgi:CRISPR system Cascade subunit CasB
MYPYLVPYTSSLTGRYEEAFYLVASLFAAHPMAWHGGDAANFGRSMALVRERKGGDSMQRRFVALLNSRLEDLPEHLRHAVALCETEEVPVDWLRLLWDLPHWDNPERRVQLNWARQFWKREDPPTPSRKES